VALGGNVVDSVFVVNADGTQNRQASDLSYESIVGWSPDGARLYFVAPYSGGAAWKVYAFELASGVSQELFTIENGTPKFLDPTLSPDGQWIAYRGRDNSSLYLVHPDGSDMHLVLEDIGVVRNEWSLSGWLGVSLGEVNTDEHTLVLVKPDGCEAYRLPDLGGELQGLFIP
jgi:Tol biopolymer transport system component